MAGKTLTKNYSVLRGFSTDSKFVRPSNVSDKSINMMRLPDGTFSPRRGYQVEIDDVGGLGIGIYESIDLDDIQPICISRDGNLYVQKTGTMTVSFNDPNNNPESYVTYELYVDPDTVSDTQTCDFDPYLVVDDRALVNDCLGFRMNQLTGYSGVSIGTTSATYSGVLTGFPIKPGSILFTDGTLTIQDDAIGGWYGDTGVGTNTINYTTGAYDVTFNGVTGAVTARYQTTLQEQFDRCLGKGFNENPSYKISSLVSLISTLTGVTVVTTGSTNHPAAFIEIAEQTNIADGKSVTLNWYYWESAHRTISSTFSGLASKINSDEFRNATFAAYEESVFIANRFDEVQKYDGQTVYRAGMPRGATPTALTSGGGTGVDNGSHTWYITYEQIDHNGSIVEGRPSIGDAYDAGSAKDINVTFANLVQGSGWNTNCAIVDGAQGPINTITVDNGTAGQAGSLRVGDTAYFFDSVENAYVTRAVTAITATSITVAGAAVTVADNDPISNNLRIKLWRTGSSGTTRYLVRSLANNSYSANQTFLDATSDATLETQLEYDVLPRQSDPPPKVGIVVAFQGQLIFTDDPVNDDYVWFSEPPKFGVGQPEYVPQNIDLGDVENSFIIPSNDDDVTGAGVAGSTLLIFKDKSIYGVYGDLATSQFTVQTVAPGSNIGCVSHHTIASIGGLIYFLHSNGVYAIAETQLYPTDNFGNPVPLSLMIDQVFRQDKLELNERYVLKRATAINYTKDNQYLLYLPAEDIGGPRAGNNSSRVFCYDYQGKNWFEWIRMNAAGGWYIINDNLYWQERQKNNSTITAKKYKQHRKYRLIDQVDHVTPIRVTWESSWEDLGQPRVRKKFVRSVMLFDEISALYQQNIPTLCFYSYKDWVDGRVSTRSDIMQKLQGGKWSTDHWNWIGWSGYQDSFITVGLKGGTVAKSLKIGLQLNTINSTFRLQGFQQEISSDFRKTVVR